MTNDALFISSGHSITIDGLTKFYQIRSERVLALDNINLKVQAGDAISIMGPSGCGKTTLLNLLAGVDRPSSGRIVFGESDLSKVSERDLEMHRLRKVGFIFQLFNLIPSLTALENLEVPMMLAGVPKEHRRERGLHLLAMVDMGDKAGKRPDELSGGEQQRVAAALAMVNDPPVILADEPTGNLDSRNIEILMGILVSLARDYRKTVIMASHDPMAAALFPRTLRMRDGHFE